jgi:hypothetical protein
MGQEYVKDSADEDDSREEDEKEEDNGEVFDSDREKSNDSLVIGNNAMDWISSRSRKAFTILSRIEQNENALFEQLFASVSIDPDARQQSMLWFKQIEVECLLHDDEALEKARNAVEGCKADLQLKLQMEKQSITDKSFPTNYMAELIFNI